MTGFLLFIGTILHFITIPFYPLVRNYSESDYSAGVQNWAIIQDSSSNFMYIANNSGLLEFDGSKWSLYELPNQNIARSLYIKDSRIYIGAYEEFGYFTRNNLGSLDYHSLKDSTQNFTFNNDEIWNIAEINGELVFQSFRSLFFYNGKTIDGVEISSLPLNIFNVNGKSYSQQIDGGLCIFEGRKLVEIIDKKSLGKSEIVAGLPYGDDVLFLTENSGGYIYKDKTLTKWNTYPHNFFNEHIINRAIVTKDGLYIIGTISDGIYALNKNGELLWKLNSDNKLINNTILGLYCDNNNNVWAALDRGIAYIQNNSLVSYFEPSHKNIGMIYDVLVRENDAYIASNQGLFYMKNGNVSLVPGLQEQAWYVDERGGEVFCGHNTGTYLISGVKSTKISDVRGGMITKEITHKGQNFLLEGTYTNLNIYTKNSSGNYRLRNSFPNFDQMIDGIEVDPQGNIWAQHLRKGIYRLTISPDFKELKNIKFYDNIGDKQGNSIKLFKINGRVIFYNGDKYYTYNDMSDSIIPYNKMNEMLPQLDNIHSVIPASDNNYWFVGSKSIYLVDCTINNYNIIQDIPYSIFGGFSEEKRSSIVYDPNNKDTYLCLNNAIVRIDSDSTSLYKNSNRRVLSIKQISGVTEYDKKTKYYPVIDNNKIDSKYNSINISLSYPEYKNHDYSIKYQLDGFSDQWVEKDKELSMSYLNLPSGKYVFNAEIYYQDNIISSVSLPLEILKPWYLSHFLIIIYIILGFALVLYIQYSIISHIRKKKERVLEKEHILHKIEVETQQKQIVETENKKLEADLRIKGKELSNVVLSNIAHQQFLNSLKEELITLKLKASPTRRDLDRITTLINNNIVTDEEKWSMFQANFDLIHDNFFRTLKTEYPNLTSSDLNFCALLRLNMQTKDIAQFLNISIRGVDAARYRIRKKLNLHPDISLTDFMININSSLSPEKKML